VGYLQIEHEEGCGEEVQPEEKVELRLKMPSDHPINQIPGIAEEIAHIRAHLEQLEQKINAIGGMTDQIYRAVFATQQEQQPKSGIVVPGRG
jgi:hypothetical protein